jgi:hypothetical protein
VFHQIAWDVLGAERTGRLVFHGARQSLTRSVVPGVMTVAFQGSVQLGGAIRHVVIPLRFAMLQPARIRVIGRGRAFCSDYGLTGWRTGLPFGAEQPILLVWDLVLQPFVP